MKKNVRCAEIGQHPLRFPWGFDEEDDGCRPHEAGDGGSGSWNCAQRGVTEFRVACDPAWAVRCRDHQYSAGEG